MNRTNQDEFVKRTLSLAVPFGQLGQMGASAIENVLRCAGSGAVTVAKTAGASTEFVRKNMIVPAVSRFPPFQFFMPSSHRAEQTAHFTQRQSKACRTLRKASSRRLATAQHLQFRKLNDGLRSGAAVCSVTVARLPPSGRMLVAINKPTQQAQVPHNWAESIGFQSSLL